MQTMGDNHDSDKFNDSQSQFMREDKLQFGNMMKTLGDLAGKKFMSRISAKDLQFSDTNYHANPSISKFKESHFDTYEQEYRKYFQNELKDFDRKLN